MVMMKRQSSTGSTRSYSTGEYNYYGGNTSTHSVYPVSYDTTTKKPGLQRNLSSGSNSYSRNNIHRSTSNSNRKANSLGRMLTIFQYAIFLLVSILCFKTHMSLKRTKADLIQSNEEYVNMYHKYAQKEEELDQLHTHFTALNLNLRSITQIDTGDEIEVDNRESRQRVANTFIGRIEAQNERLDSLKAFILQNEQKDLEKKYGVGPYAVEVCVVVEGVRKYFTIQTVPNDIAPHAVRIFMDMVSQKFWDDSVFYHQVEHVVIGVPVNTKGESKNSSGRQLLFSEYNDYYPHKEFTLGFQGNPGGPEFYINLDDNSKSHGPGGQAGDKMHNGDTCFGSITHGQDIVSKFRELNVKASSNGGVYYSKIESMKIVKVL